MSGSENEADNINLSFSPGFPTPSDQYLMSISAFREAIRNLSQLLIDNDWRDLTSDSRLLKVMEEQLRDIIKNLEQLGNDPSGNKIDLQSILNVLCSALVELYKASDLSNVPDIQVSSLRYDHFIACRQYLNLAIKLMLVYQE